MVVSLNGVNGHNVVIYVEEENRSEIELVIHLTRKMEGILVMGITQTNSGAMSIFAQVREQLI